MHAVIGRVTIKPGREDETLAMIGERGVAMLEGMAGSDRRLLGAEPRRGRRRPALLLALRDGGRRPCRRGDLQHAPRHARGAGHLPSAWTSARWSGAPS